MTSRDIRPGQIWHGPNIVTGKLGYATVLNVLGDQIEVQFKKTGEVVTVRASDMTAGVDGWRFI
jgi:hypothetical protein